jgi:hypothetical protein
MMNGNLRTRAHTQIFIKIRFFNAIKPRQTRWDFIVPSIQNILRFNQG